MKFWQLTSSPAASSFGEALAGLAGAGRAMVLPVDFSWLVGLVLFQVGPILAALVYR
jgi:hypothetical protein